MRSAPRLDNLGFLLARASHRWNERLTAGFAARGFAQVRASYGSVLVPLWAEDGLRMGTLAARAGLSKQTMTTLVRLAERDGLVAPQPDTADRRATRVWLTPLALEFAPIAAQVVDDVQHSVIATLGPRRTRSLEHILSVLVHLDKE
jgi:DNA-binding MarR family transcriptional regulator